MAAPVRIEARAWSDIRFVTLARLLGLADPDYALIKVARLWAWQTEHYTDERPTYEVDRDTIESALGPGAPEAMVRARLATETASGYRIHGTEGQIEWRRELTSTRQLAGRARAAGAKRDSRGRLLPAGNGSRDYESPAPTPASHQRLTSGSPAKSSALTLTLTPEDQDLPPARAHAIPPSTDPAQGQRQALRAAIWRELGDARTSVAATLGVAYQPLLAQDPGERSLAMLLVGARGELDATAKAARHAIAVAAAEAKRDRSLQWLTGVIFDERNFRRLAGMTLEDARRPRPVAKGAKGDPPPHVSRRPDLGPPPVVIPKGERAGAAELAESMRLLGIRSDELDDEPEPEEQGVAP